MKSNVINQIKLDNGQTLVIEDLSRKIGADAYVVILKASMSIAVEPALFSPDLFSSDQLNGIQIDDIIAKLGQHVTYEYKVERNMIMDHEKDLVFEALLQAFLDNLKDYLEKPSFPGKLVLKQYRDLKK